MSSCFFVVLVVTAAAAAAAVTVAKDNGAKPFDTRSFIVSRPVLQDVPVRSRLQLQDTPVRNRLQLQDPADLIRPVVPRTVQARYIIKFSVLQ